MTYVREETLGNFSEEELLRMFKESLDELGIAYEEIPEGSDAAHEGALEDWSGFLGLDPSDFEPEEEYAESYTIQKRASGRDHYQRKDSVSYAMGLTIDPVGDHIWEDGPAPAAA